MINTKMEQMHNFPWTQILKKAALSQVRRARYIRTED